MLTYQNQQPSNAFTPVFTLATGPTLPAPYNVSPNGTFPLENLATCNATTTVGCVTPKFRPSIMTLPTNYTYNGSLQYQLTSKVQVTGSYVGNTSRHQFIGTGQSINPNEPVFVPGVTQTAVDRPYYSLIGAADLQYYCNCSNEQYNSFQSTVTVRAWAGWTLQGNYTYQRQYGDGWGYDSNYYFMYDRAAGVGYDSLLPRNQITLAQNFNIPFGRGRKWGGNANRAVDFVLGGWNLGGITTYYSGVPFSPSIDNYGPNAKPNVGPNNRPDKGSGDPYSGAQGNRNQWFVGCPNQNCTSGPFVYPASNTFGNYPINVLFGPHFIQQDVSLMKRFAFTERIGLTLRTDASNAFNHTNLGSPNSDVQSSTAGQITGLAFGGNNMRKLQYSLTMNF